MSADSVIVFYGTQISLSESDIIECEKRTHPMIKATRDTKLDFYWTDFIPNDDHGPELLIGRRFGSFGAEDNYEAHIERGTLTLTIELVDRFLSTIGHTLPGKLIVRYEQSV